MRESDIHIWIYSDLYNDWNRSQMWPMKKRSGILKIFKRSARFAGRNSYYARGDTGAFWDAAHTQNVILHDKSKSKMKIYKK